MDQPKVNPFRILVDTQAISFSNELPLPTDVSTTENVELSITISDATSGINSSSIEYSVSKDRGKTWSVWYPVEGLENDMKIDVKINHTFPNGTDNILKWRASDIAGNG
ncbi:MAG: hypothetical protein KAJ51_08865, partial [Thermoplasmata archaeon]|nr:hypothetical protein [Thermoplasmata archaeon]